MSILRICEFCFQEFETRNVYISRGGGRFCTHACWAKNRHTSQSIENRFWLNVSQCEHGYDCIFCCWLWHNAVNPTSGYGTFSETIGYRKDQKVYAHRKSWMIHNMKELPRQEMFWVIKHECNNKLCVNPSHLTYAKKKSNAEDAVRDNLIPRGEHNGNAKLYDSEVELIRKLINAGIKQKIIAAMFKITQTTVSNIKSGYRRR